MTMDELPYRRSMFRKLGLIRMIIWPSPHILPGKPIGIYR